MSISAVSASENVTDNATLTSLEENVLENNELETPISTESNDTDSTENDTSDDEPVNLVSKFSAKDVTSTYGKKTKFSVKLLDSDGNPMANKQVTFNINGKTYNVNSTSNGIAAITFKLNAGKYTIKYSADELTGKNTIKDIFQITIINLITIKGLIDI